MHPPHKYRRRSANVVTGGKFAPVGQRGLFTSRQGYGVEDYFAKANDETLLMVLIEDIAAVGNLDELLAVDHIDVFFVAPNDLAASMGHIGDIEHPEVQRTINETLARIQTAGRVAGTTADDSTIERYVKAGVRCFLAGTSAWIAAGAANYIQRAESAKG